MTLKSKIVYYCLLYHYFTLNSRGGQYGDREERERGGEGDYYYPYLLFFPLTASFEDFSDD